MVGRPEFIRVVQFRPKGRNSLTTFRGQTALRGCPRPRLAALTRREKALYCPFLKEGVRNVARRLVGEITHAIGRARAHSFPLSKRARLFPSAAYRRSAPPQLALGRLNQCKLGYCIAAWITSWCRKTGLIFSSAFDSIHTQIAPVGILRHGLDSFATQNASVNLESRWHLL